MKHNANTKGGAQNSTSLYALGHKLLCILLAVTLSICLVPANAFADSADAENAKATVESSAEQVSTDETLGEDTAEVNAANAQVSTDANAAEEAASAEAVQATQATEATEATEAATTASAESEDINLLAETDLQAALQSGSNLTLTTTTPDAWSEGSDGGAQCVKAADASLTVEGAGWVIFEWKFTDAANWKDYFEYSVDGGTSTEIQGNDSRNKVWATKVAPITGTGSHTITWSSANMQTKNKA